MKNLNLFNTIVFVWLAYCAFSGLYEFSGFEVGGAMILLALSSFSSYLESKLAI